MAKSARLVDANGYMTVKDCPIAREGIFEYSAAQVGLPGDPNRIVNVYRPAYAVQDQNYLNSIRSIPLIDDHYLLDGSEDGNSTGGEAPEEVGIDGIVTDSVKFKNPWVVGDLKIFSRKMKKALDDGKAELSLGYSCDFKPANGRFQGQAYEMIQDNMFANHLALVDSARVAGARVLDCKLSLRINDSKDGKAGKSIFNVIEAVGMAKQTKPVSNATNKRQTRDNAVQELQNLIPALKQFLSEEAQEPAHQDAEQVQNTAEGAQSQEAAQQKTAPVEQTEQAQTEPVQSQQQEGGDNSQLIATIESILAKLKGGAQQGQPSEPEPTAVNTTEESGEVAAEEPQESETQEPQEGDNMNPEEKTEDAVEGLQENETTKHEIGADEGEFAPDADMKAEDDFEEEANDDEETQAADEEPKFSGCNGKAPEGPKAGKNTMAGDAAIRAAYADAAKKQKLYDRLSNVVGAFDHSLMTCGDMEKYGCKKVGLSTVTKGHGIALDAYLMGVEKQTAKKTQIAQRRQAGDAAVSGGMAAYLKGTK